MAAACAEDTSVVGKVGRNHFRQASAFDGVGGVLWWLSGNPVSASCPTYCVSAGTGTRMSWLPYRVCTFNAFENVGKRFIYSSSLTYIWAWTDKSCYEFC
jgi:hypothetical protein